MATDINQIVTVGYLQSYDKLIKSAYKAADTALETKVMEALGKITSFEVKLVDELPATGETGFIYFVPKKDGYSSGEQNVYEEYLWIEKTPASEDGLTPAVFAFEKIGDTKIDVDALKDEIAEDYVASVDVTYVDNIATINGVTQSAYTLSLKNGKGEEIDSEQINVISAIGVAVADRPSDADHPEAVYGHDGLMSKEDKATLDTLSADMSQYMKTVDADAKYVASAELGDYSDVTSGAETTHTATVTLSSADDTELDSFEVKYVTYGEATDAAAGLMAAADKAKLDGLNLASPGDVDDWFADNWPSD